MEDKQHKHPVEHKLAAYYHRMTLIRTIAPILMLIIQTVVLFIQVAIATKIFNVSPQELFTTITTLVPLLEIEKLQL